MSDQSPVRRLHHLLREAVTCLETNRPDINQDQGQGGSTSSALTPGGADRAPVRRLSFQPSAVGLLGCSSWVLSERNSLFNYGGCSSRPGGKRAKSTPAQKKRRLSVWNHEFYCLSSTDQSKVPSVLEKYRLISAGK